jgi:hypothetical protein
LKSAAIAGRRRLRAAGNGADKAAAARDRPSRDPAAARATFRHTIEASLVRHL